jgi:drug/metabolite transporter (DMT)-like permease
MAAAVRFTIASVLFASILLLGFGRRFPNNAKQTIWICAAGVTGAMSAGLTYSAETCISGGVCSIINSTSPLFVAFIALMSGVERIGRRSVAGCLLALLGVAVLFQDRLSVSLDQGIGVCLMLGSVLISSMNSVILKKYTKQQHPFAIAAIITVIGAMVCGLTSAGVEQQALPWPPPVVPSMAALYLAVFGSVIAFACFFFLLQNVSLMTVSTLVFFPPLIAICVDAVFEKGFVLAPVGYLGMVITLVGVIVTVLAPKALSR